MDNYIIYCHTNKINGKKYIGQTCQSPPQKRWQYGLGYRGCTRFYNAIKKYGWGNFQHQILFTGLSLEQANQKQTELIQKYKTYDANYGYNISLGGGNRVMSDSTKQKLRQAKLGSNNPNYGKHVSKETRQKMSDAHKKEKAPWYGKHLTDQTKEKLSASHKGKKQSQETIEKRRKSLIGKHTKQVRCIQTGQVFNSVKEATEWCGLSSHCSISNYLNGKSKSAGTHPVTGQKLHWEYI